jgi:hypothetical protein
MASARGKTCCGHPWLVTPGAVSVLVSFTYVRTVHQRSRGGHWRRSRTVENSGERTSAVLESVLGQPLKSSNLLSSATPDLGKRLPWLALLLGILRAQSHFLVSVALSELVLSRAERPGSHRPPPRTYWWYATATTGLKITAHHAAFRTVDSASPGQPRSTLAAPSRVH